MVSFFLSFAVSINWKNALVALCVECFIHCSEYFFRKQAFVIIFPYKDYFKSEASTTHMIFLILLRNFFIIINNLTRVWSIWWTDEWLKLLNLKKENMHVQFLLRHHRCRNYFTMNWMLEEEIWNFLNFYFP